MDQRRSVRGVNVYPSEIESVVLEFDEVAPHYRIDLRREGPLDAIEMTVERARDFDGDAADLEARLTERLANVLALTSDELTIAGPDTIGRTEVGKAKRGYDHRD